MAETPALARTLGTRELDRVLAAVFGLWEDVIAAERLFALEPKLALPLKGPRKRARPTAELKPVADEDG